MTMTTGGIWGWRARMACQVASRTRSTALIASLSSVPGVVISVLWVCGLVRSYRSRWAGSDSTS
jgi:hypothetical protein